MTAKSQTSFHFHIHTVHIINIDSYSLFLPAEECGTLSVGHDGSSRIAHIDLVALSTPALDNWHFLALWQAL